MKSLTTKIDWKKVKELVPVIIQDASTKAVLMLGYMNEAALVKTEETGFVWFYSRTKERLWQKGETSGNTLRVRSITLDCDQDSLLISVIPAGPVCHKKTTSCFEGVCGEAIHELFSVIEKRKKDMPEGSYTTTLFKAGLDRIALKLSEEALEVVQAAIKETKDRVKEESVDLLFHLFVLLSERGVSLEEVEEEIRKRNSKTASRQQ